MITKKANVYSLMQMPPELGWRPLSRVPLHQLCVFAMPSCTHVVVLGGVQKGLNKIEIKIYSWFVWMRNNCGFFNIFWKLEHFSLPRIEAAGSETWTPSPNQYWMRSKFNATSFSSRSFGIGSNEPTCSITWSFGSRNLCKKKN